MNGDQWRSLIEVAVAPIDLLRMTEEKAQRFAESPAAGYLAGYSPHHRPVPGEHDDRVAHLGAWNDELSWLYAVAEQDIPETAYRWGIVERADGRFKLILDPVEPEEG
jgi:hypothetical protein